MKNTTECGAADGSAKNCDAGAFPLASGSALWGADWQDSCDNCLHQEGRHYCLFHAKQIKNMDAVRCGSWKSKHGSSEEISDQHPEPFGLGMWCGCCGSEMSLHSNQYWSADKKICCCSADCLAEASSPNNEGQTRPKNT